MKTEKEIHGRLKQVEDKCEAIISACVESNVDEHIYWKMLRQSDREISLLKWVLS